MLISLEDIFYALQEVLSRLFNLVILCRQNFVNVGVVKGDKLTHQ